jgi:hypothetical protein
MLSPGKVLRHGDRVRNNAELVLESARYPGRYLAFNTGSASLNASEAVEASLLPHAYISRRFECYLAFHRQVFLARIFRQGGEGRGMEGGVDHTSPAPSAVPMRKDRSLVVHGAERFVEAANALRRIVGTDIVQVYLLCVCVCMNVCTYTHTHTHTHIHTGRTMV